MLSSTSKQKGKNHDNQTPLVVPRILYWVIIEQVNSFYEKLWVLILIIIQVLKTFWKCWGRWEIQWLKLRKYKSNIAGIINYVVLTVSTSVAHQILWVHKYSSFYKLICEEFLMPLYELIFLKESNCISESAMGVICEYVDYYFSWERT